MSESHKRRIFEMALQSCPVVHNEFKVDCLDTELDVGFYQVRLQDGNIIWSPGMFRLTERDPALETPTLPELYLNFAAPEDNESYLSDMRLIVEGQKKYGIGYVHIVTFKGRPGILKYIILPVTDEHEHVVGVCGWLASKSSSQDHTSNNSVTRNSSKEENSFEKGIMEKHNVVANIFHEVRIPINSVYLGLQSLEEEVSDPELRKLISTMKLSTERAISILNDTLDYSKLEQGYANIRATPMNISTCITQCANEFKVSTQRRNISLSTNLICDCVCEIDGTRITQVMSNLLSNALKFTPDHGCITITLTHTFDTSGEWAVISVSDTGVGIAQEDLNRIFTPYHQIDNQVEGRKGMGIGLSICKKIVDAHHGEISVYSTPGKGSTFVVRLPAMKGAVDTSPQESVEAKRARVRGEMKGLHVLLVDDDDVNMRILTRMLTKSGCTVDTLKDGKEFLEYTRNPTKKLYNMILLDDYMKTLDGSDAIQTARGEGFKLFTILLTGNMNEKIIECGANAVLHKPLKFADLREVVHKYLL